MSPSVFQVEVCVRVSFLSLCECVRDGDHYINTISRASYWVSVVSHVRILAADNNQYLQMI